MRNLKKVLALVLSLVMALSLVTVAGAATFEETFTDASSVSDDYVQAVNVVNGLKVFQGQTDTEFAPKGTFNRAQLAGLAYRIDTGDTAGYGKDSSGRYVQSGTFYDVPDDAWYAGYVGYCYGAGLISGRGNGSYDPMTPVTGTDVLAILLHLVGYKDLFKGANWSIEVAAKAQQLGLLDKVVTANDLTGTASRELVCELSFRTLTQAEMVQKNTATEGYLTLHNLIPGVNTGVANKDDGIDKDITLGEQKFKLVHDDQSYTYDDWGRPSTGWYKADSITYSGSGFAGQSVKKVTIKAKPFVYVPCTITKSYTTADTECEIYEDLGLTATTNTFELWVNGREINVDYVIDKLDTRTMVGGQNRLTEVYMDYDGDGTNRIVMIDTYLALVVENNKATYDSSDHSHVRTPAHMILTVFDTVKGTRIESADNYAGAAKNYVVVNDPQTETWEYEVGDMILINAYTNKDATIAGGEAAAYTSYRVAAKASTNSKEVTKVLGKAEYVDGTLDQWRKNSTFHKVDGTQYDDSMIFRLDDCESNTKNQFRWWLDGTNLMGVTAINADSNYGIITRLWFVDDTADGSTGTAYANITYSNGETAKKIPISEFVVQGKWSTNEPKDGDVGKAMSLANTDTNPVPISLKPVHGDATGTNAMVVVDHTGTYGGKTIGKNHGHDTGVGMTALDWSTLTVSTDGPSNAAATANEGIAEFDILNKQLFKFVTNNDGDLIAYEVAGDGTGAGANRVYKGMYNAKEAGKTDYAQVAITPRSYSYDMSINGTDLTGAHKLRMSGSTQIMVVNAGTGALVGTYVGYETMPALTAAGTTEVDWVDVDGDQFADYVLIVGVPDNEYKHVLFFFDGEDYGIESKTYTATGYVDGEKGTVTFKKNSDGKALLDRITADDCRGVLWGLELKDGVVNAIFNPKTNAGGSTGNWTDTKDARNMTDAGLTLASKLSTNKTGAVASNLFDASKPATTSKSIYYTADELIYISAEDLEMSRVGSTYVIGDNDYLISNKTKVVSLDDYDMYEVYEAVKAGDEAFSLFVVSDGAAVARYVYIVPEASDIEEGDLVPEAGEITVVADDSDGTLYVFIGEEEPATADAKEKKLTSLVKAELEAKGYSDVEFSGSIAGGTIGVTAKKNGLDKAYTLTVADDLRWDCPTITISNRKSAVGNYYVGEDASHLQALTKDVLGNKISADKPRFFATKLGNTWQFSTAVNDSDTLAVAANGTGTVVYYGLVKLVKENSNNIDNTYIDITGLPTSGGAYYQFDNLSVNRCLTVGEANATGWKIGDGTNLVTSNWVAYGTNVGDIDAADNSSHTSQTTADNPDGIAMFAAKEAIKVTAYDSTLGEENRNLGTYAVTASGGNFGSAPAALKKGTGSYVGTDMSATAVHANVTIPFDEGNVTVHTGYVQLKAAPTVSNMDNSFKAPTYLLSSADSDGNTDRITANKFVPLKTTITVTFKAKSNLTAYTAGDDITATGDSAPKTGTTGAVLMSLTSSNATVFSTDAAVDNTNNLKLTATATTLAEDDTVTVVWKLFGDFTGAATNSVAETRQ